MDVFRAIMERKSIRKFEKKPVDDKLIGVMLYMATQAPSVGNVQEWRFIVVKNEEQKRKLWEAALEQNQILDAPVNIVVCADLDSISLKYGKRGEVLYSIQDTAAAIENLLLAAYGLGLGTCWIGAFDEEMIKHALSLPETIRPVAIICVGYPAEDPKKPTRKPFENLTWLNKWGEKYEISYIVQPGVKREFKPLGNILEEKVKKQKKKLTFEELLRKLSKV